MMNHPEFQQKPLFNRGVLSVAGIQWLNLTKIWGSHGFPRQGRHGFFGSFQNITPLKTTRVSPWKLGTIVSKLGYSLTFLGEEINLLLLGLGHPVTKYHGHPSNMITENHKLKDIFNLQILGTINVP